MFKLKQKKKIQSKKKGILNLIEKCPYMESWRVTVENCWLGFDDKDKGVIKQIKLGTFLVPPLAVIFWVPLVKYFSV